jgi:UTP-glucose-1-phosphate uridylyltransferase
MATVTGGSAKELLKVGGLSVLERVIDEAREAMADEVVVVASPLKVDVVREAERLGAKVVLQKVARGLPDAIACAGVEDEAIVLNGDCVYGGGTPSYRIGQLLEKAIQGCIAVEKVSDEETRLYGIVEIDEGTGGIRRILEKPDCSETESRWAVAGRYGFGVPLLAFISDFAGEWVGEGELSLAEVLNAAIGQGFDLKAVALQPGQTRLDCGDPEGYRRARLFDWYSQPI